MKKLLMAGLAAATMLSFAPAAHADHTDPIGFLCGFTSVTDPTIEGSQTGEIDAGPLVLVNSANEVQSGSITCDIQTGTNDTYAEANAGSITGPTSTGVAVAAGTVTYEVGSDEDVYICTTATVEAGPVYFHYELGVWTHDPNAKCDLAISASTEPVDGPLDGLFDLLNATVCPVLLSLPEPLRTILAGLWGDCGI